MSAPPLGRHAWVDASAGIAGDMLLAALLDAGADTDRVCRVVASVVPQVRIEARDVTRGGLRALKVDIVARPIRQSHRTWADIRSLLAAADMSESVLRDATAVFQHLAEAEAAVHGLAVEQVEFHEVGAWDSIADIVGVCAAVHDLQVASLTYGPIALGSGSVESGHGRLPVPTPAVLNLVTGLQVCAGGPGELATPTGVALVSTLGDGQQDLPTMTVVSTGIGAGTRNQHARPNVVRVVIGQLTTPAWEGERMFVLEANVDDVDPRVWPTVLQTLLAAGAADAWLTPILMKKGRPAHTLHVLASLERRPALREMIFRHTPTLGMREQQVQRVALGRSWVPLEVAGGHVRIKVATSGGRVVQASAEYDDVVAVASQLGCPVRDVLDLATAASVQAGLVPGAAVPAGVLAPQHPPAAPS
ncbi:MAG: nickel pincer cofactor biosynthesis protein LarC [Dermatophilaceae bacterium]